MYLSAMTLKTSDSCIDITLIISLQCNVLLKNFGSWHLYGCYLTFETQTNSVSDKVSLVVLTALLNGGSGPAGQRTLQPDKN